MAAQWKPDIAQWLSDNPDVVAAAAALAQSDATLVHKTDPGIPVVEDRPGYDELTYGGSSPNAKQIARGITTTGRVHAPLTVARQVEYAASVDANGLPVDVQRTETTAAVEGYAKVSTQGKRLAEDALDAAGRVPEWVLRRWWSRAGSLGFAHASGPIEILVVAGQSNASKQDPVTNANVRTYDDGRVLRWDHDAGYIVVESGVEWIGSGAARQYVKDNPHKRILLVGAGRGASGFSTTSLTPAPEGYTHVSTTVGTWDRALTSDPLNYPTLLLDQRVANAAAAAQAMTGAAPVKVAMIWCQGEADNAMDPAVYESKLDDLFAWARTLWATPNLPILVASMTPARINESGVNQAGFAAIDRVHADTPRRLLRTSYFYGPENAEENTGTGLRTHFLPWANEERGAVVMSRGLHRALQNAPVAQGIETPLHPPINMGASRFGSQVKVRWEHPYCQIDGFNADYTTDGTTWTPLTLAHAMAIGVTLTEASPVKVRVRSFNDTFSSYYSEVSI